MSTTVHILYIPVAKLEDFLEAGAPLVDAVDDIFVDPVGQRAVTRLISIASVQCAI